MSTPPLWKGSPWLKSSWEKIKNTPHVKSPKNWPKKLRRWLKDQATPKPRPHLDLLWTGERSKEYKLIHISISNDPDTKPYVMLGEFYFPHPHYFRESEAPMGVWRYSQQIKIDVEDRFGIMKGLYSIKRIYDRGTYKTLQGPTPCFIMPRSGAWVKHSEIRFLTSPNYFLIQYWGERKGVGKVGGRGFCFLPHQTDEVVKEIKAAMDLLKERYDKWKYKEDLENAPDNS